jgi:hypothetical protein
MSPESEHNIFLGPPSPSKLATESSCDCDLEHKSIERNLTDTSDCIVFFINEASLCQSQVEIKIADTIVINAILYSGSELILLSERVYEKLTQSGVDIPVLPVELCASNSFWEALEAN